MAACWASIPPIVLTCSLCSLITLTRNRQTRQSCEAAAQQPSGLKSWHCWDIVWELAASCVVRVDGEVEELL